jgi:hypothetical protein
MGGHFNAGRNGRTRPQNGRPRLNPVKIKSAALLLPAFVLATAGSYAATATASMSVTVTVKEGCLVSPSRLSFGAYLAGQLNPDSAVSVTCNYSVPYTVGIAHPPPGSSMGSDPPARPYRWAMLTQPSGSTSRPDSNFDNVTMDVDPSHLVPGYSSAVSSADSIIIVVTY